jgi:probable F420-dependent oxidoreductase
MEFGICMFATDYSMQAADLAVAVEERGLDALFVPDHTHIPAERQSKFMMADELPPDYSHNVDMFLALAAAAAVTKRIRLGTGICLVVERDPIITAKEVASLDHISGGRVDFGIGGGWNREELENHGVPWRRRWKVVRERIEAMKAIWGSDEASYEGEFVRFERIQSWPKPVQKPHPPIFVGGDAPGTFNRILRYGDGWIPMLAGANNQFDLKSERMAELAALARDAGRDAFPVTTFGTPRDPVAIGELARSGVTRCIFGLKAAAAEEVLTRLDKITKVTELAKQHL